MVDKMGRAVCARVGALLSMCAHILQASLRQERHKSVELERQLASSQGCGWNSSMGPKRLALTSSTRRGIANFPPEKVVFFCSQSAHPGAKLVYVQYIICGVCVCVCLCVHTHAVTHTTAHAYTRMHTYINQ